MCNGFLSCWCIVCFQLPISDPRGAVTVALLSRLRSTEDLRAAAHLASLCFPPNLYQMQQQQAHDIQQNSQQEDHETVEHVFRELLHPGVAPAAVLHAVQPQTLLSSMRFADTLEGRQPLDLIVTDTHVSFGDMTLALQEEAPVKVREQDERIQAAQQEEQYGKLCGLLLHSQRLCVSAVAAALAAGFPVLLTGERGAGELTCPSSPAYPWPCLYPSPCADLPVLLLIILLCRTLLPVIILGPYLHTYV